MGCSDSGLDGYITVADLFKKNDEGTKKDMFPTVPDKERCHFLSGQRTGTYGPSAHSQEWVLDCWAPTNAVQVWFQGRSWESQDAETVARPGDIKCEGLSFQGRRR